MGIKVQPSFVQLCISCFCICYLNEIAQFSSSLICTPATETQKSLIINFSQGRLAGMWKGLTGYGYSWFLQLIFKFFFFLTFYFILYLYLLILGGLLDFPFLVACACVPSVIRVYAAAEYCVSVIYNVSIIFHDLFLLFSFMCLCLCAENYVLVSTYFHRGYNPLEVKLQVHVIHLMWVLWTELWFFGRAVNVLLTAKLSL